MTDESNSSPIIARKASEHAFRVSDGIELFYRAWLPPEPAHKALILFHRGHEHSGRWEETVEKLGLHDVAIFAWDARGHGQSPGDRGSAENLARIVLDADEFMRHISAQYGYAQEETIVMAHSVGAVIAAVWVHDYAPRLRGLILAAPAFHVKLYIPFAVPLLRLRQKLFGQGYVKSYVKAKMLTHDRVEAAKYEDDPMIFRQIAVNILLDLRDASDRVIADAAAIIVPTLMFEAGNDWVVKSGPQREFFQKLSSPRKRIEILPGFHHAVFHEKDRRLLIDHAREFIVDCFARPAELPSLLDSDKRGPMKEEYDRLRQPGSVKFSMTKSLMNSVGRLSKGIELGWKAGFDSGVTLDYVYENRVQGTTPLGKALDRNYLNSIGWEGIRRRRVHIQRILRETIERTHAAGKPVRVLDIASGAGRYLLETIHQSRQIPITAVLRDYQEKNLEAARKLAGELGLSNATIVQGDAFDRDSLAAVSPRPTIGIVSGLYELFPENEPVLRSLRGLADALEPGSHLIYTNQPWHPQVEFIARVLTNREGKPWIMRRRSQAEMDQLVREAGFEKLEQAIDPWGIFTVSLARRVSA